MTETNAYILDSEKLNHLIETLRYCQGSFERELQGLDHFLQGTILEMNRHVQHIKGQKAQAEADLEQAKADLEQAEVQRDTAEADLQNKETQVDNAGNYVGQMKEERDAAYENLNYQKESMRDAYHPEYNEVISDCWDDINDAKDDLNNAYAALDEAKKERNQARGALRSAEQKVSSCTSRRDKAKNRVQKWTSRIPEAENLFIEVRRLLEDNYYATPSAFDGGGPDWKMTQMVDDIIPRSISKLQEIIKAIEAYTGTPVSSLKPYTWGMAREGGEDVPRPLTDSAMDETVQTESDSFYAEIRKGFRPNPSPNEENLEVRCRSCGRRLSECRCRTIEIS
jgi:chromosome segregation ATPase